MFWGDFSNFKKFSISSQTLDIWIDVQNKTREKVYNFYIIKYIWIEWGIRHALIFPTSYWTPPNSFSNSRTKDWCACNIKVISTIKKFEFWWNLKNFKYYVILFSININAAVFLTTWKSVPGCVWKTHRADFYL